MRKNYPQRKSGRLEITELSGGRDFSLQIFKPGDGLVSLVDLGEWPAKGLDRLSHVKQIFVSHAHIDHFISFDRLVRFALGVSGTITLWGPDDFINRVKGRLSGYTWNLVELSELTIKAVEISEDGRQKSCSFNSWECFKPVDYQENYPREMQDNSLSEKIKKAGIIYEDAYLKVRYAVLDHRIPVIAYRFEEPERWAVDVKAVEKEGLKTGSWLSELKKNASENLNVPNEFHIEKLDITLKHNELKRILKPAFSGSITYISDTIYNEKTLKKAVELASGTDILYCEASYLNEDIKRAQTNYHLTAAQAGIIAREAGAKRLVIFHMANIYNGRHEDFINEASAEAGNIPIYIGGK